MDKQQLLRPSTLIKIILAKVAFSSDKNACYDRMTQLI
jgi:hypothetical protein